MIINMSKIKIGIALGGGGARGVAHIGVLKTLDKERIKVDLIVGVSSGAFAGACYCLGITPLEMEQEMATFNRRKSWHRILDFTAFNGAILKGDKVYNYIRQTLEEKSFADTKIPLQIVATDLANGEEVILKKGNLAKAVQASISVPGIFPPVKINDRYLIDGGVVNPTPIDVAKKMGADIIIGVDLITKKANVIADKPSMITTLIQSYEIIRNQAVKFKMREAGNDAIIIKPKLRRMIDSFKFYDLQKFIDSGEEATLEAMPEIKRRLAKLEK